MNEKPLCKQRVWGGWSYHGCSRPAKSDGYCATHHPDAVKRRNEKSSERWEVKRAEMQKRNDEYRERERRADCFDDLLAALKLWDSGCRVMDGPAPNCECYGCRTRAAIAKAEGK